jgi:hypothetical protein
MGYTGHPLLLLLLLLLQGITLSPTSLYWPAVHRSGKPHQVHHGSYKSPAAAAAFTTNNTGILVLANTPSRQLTRSIMGSYRSS